MQKWTSKRHLNKQNNEHEFATTTDNKFTSYDVHSMLPTANTATKKQDYLHEVSQFAGNIVIVQI